MAFSSLGLHADLLRGVQELGFTEPSPIQKDAIPPAIEGRDVLACSATGSGKTAAFMLPILHKLLTARRPGRFTRALILTPTRELAAQIEEHIGQLAKFTKVSSASVYGGVAMGPQRRALQTGCDIIVATPGRLLDHFRSSHVRLDGLETLVLDEADRMLDMGFMPDIQRILDTLPAKKQTLFFSATMPAPIKALTKKLLNDPATINLERQAAPATGITQTLFPVPHMLKSSLLLKMLEKGEMRSVLAFTRTKHRADRLAEYMKRNGVACGLIHGGRTQSQRSHALDSFKAGKFKLLVATDIAARGIDVDELSHVVNFDVPHIAEDYIHRVGRTARAKSTGDAFTFVSPEEEKNVRIIEKAINQKVKRATLEGFDYNNVPPPRDYSSGGGSSNGGGQRRGGYSSGGNSNGGGNRRFSRERSPERSSERGEQQPMTNESAPRTSPHRPWEKSNWRGGNGGGSGGGGASKPWGNNKRSGGNFRSRRVEA